MTQLSEAAAIPGTAAVDAALYAQIQQFYAAHMQSVDNGDAHAWALGFTEDGVFDSNVLPEPVSGRAAIERATLEGEAARRPTGVTRRHVMTMLTVEESTADAVRTRCYVVVFATRPKERSEIYCTTVCEDELVRGAHGGWLVRSRNVLRDDLPPRG
jgi:3-phenylpropionate/cinnamic acid dioxygenase small subunit